MTIQSSVCCTTQIACQWNFSSCLLVCVRPNELCREQHVHIRNVYTCQHSHTHTLARTCGIIIMLNMVSMSREIFHSQLKLKFIYFPTKIYYMFNVVCCLLMIFISSAVVFGATTRHCYCRFHFSLSLPLPVIQIRFSILIQLRCIYTVCQQSSIFDE